MLAKLFVLVVGGVKPSIVTFISDGDLNPIEPIDATFAGTVSSLIDVLLKA